MNNSIEQGVPHQDNSIVVEEPLIYGRRKGGFYAVEKLVQKVVGDRGRVLFEVKWAGWDDEHNTLVPLRDLVDCDELLQEYYNEHGEEDTLFYVETITRRFKSRNGNGGHVFKYVVKWTCGESTVELEDGIPPDALDKFRSDLREMAAEAKRCRICDAEFDRLYNHHAKLHADVERPLLECRLCRGLFKDVVKHTKRIHNIDLKEFA